MKTKEQILNDAINEHPFQGLDEEERVIAIGAMDEFATQQSIAFAEWVVNKGYRYLKSSNWWTNSNDDNFTTEQLYNIYISTIK